MAYTSWILNQVQKAFCLIHFRIEIFCSAGPDMRWSIAWNQTKHSSNQWIRSSCMLSQLTVFSFYAGNLYSVTEWQFLYIAHTKEGQHLLECLLLKKICKNCWRISCWYALILCADIRAVQCVQCTTNLCSLMHNSSFVLAEKPTPLFTSISMEVDSFRSFISQVWRVQQDVCWSCAVC